MRPTPSPRARAPASPRRSSSSPLTSARTSTPGRHLLRHALHPAAGGRHRRRRPAGPGLPDRRHLPGRGTTVTPVTSRSTPTSRSRWRSRRTAAPDRLQRAERLHRPDRARRVHRDRQPGHRVHDQLELGRVRERRHGRLRAGREHHLRADGAAGPVPVQRLRRHRRVRLHAPTAPRSSNVGDPSSQPWVTSVGGTSLEGDNPAPTRTRAPPPRASRPSGMSTTSAARAARADDQAGLLLVRGDRRGQRRVQPVLGPSLLPARPGREQPDTTYSATVPTARAARWPRRGRRAVRCRTSPPTRTRTPGTPSTARATRARPTAPAPRSAGRPAPGWFGIGGTSLSSPLWSALIADRDSFNGHRSGNINPLAVPWFNIDPRGTSTTSPGRAGCSRRRPTTACTRPRPATTRRPASARRSSPRSSPAHSGQARKGARRNLLPGALRRLGELSGGGPLGVQVISTSPATPARALDRLSLRLTTVTRTSRAARFAAAWLVLRRSGARYRRHSTAGQRILPSIAAPTIPGKTELDNFAPRVGGAYRHGSQDSGARRRRNILGWRRRPGNGRLGRSLSVCHPPTPIAEQRTIKLPNDQSALAQLLDPGPCCILPTIPSLR